MHTLSVSKTSLDRTIQLEKYMQCPRCKYKLLKYRSLSANVEKSLDELQYTGICDHCHNQIQYGFQEAQHILPYAGNDDNMKTPRDKMQILKKSPEKCYLNNKEGLVLKKSVSDIHIDKLNIPNYFQANLKRKLLVEKKIQSESEIILSTVKDQPRGIKFTVDRESSMFSKSDDDNDVFEKDLLLNDSTKTLDSIDIEDLNRKWEKLKFLKDQKRLPQLFQTGIKDQLHNISKEWHNIFDNISWSDDNVNIKKGKDKMKNFYKSHPVYSKKGRGIKLARSFSDTQMDEINWPDYLHTHFKQELLIEKKNQTIKDKSRAEKFTNNRNGSVDSNAPSKDRFLIDSMKTFDGIDIEDLSKKWKKIRLLKEDNQDSQLFDSSKTNYMNDFSSKKLFHEEEDRTQLEKNKQKLTHSQRYRNQSKLKSLSEINLRKNIKSGEKRSDDFLLTSTPFRYPKSLDDFQYFFPKRASLTHIPIYQKSSLELIKETLEKFNKTAAKKKDTVITPKKPMEETIIHNKKEEKPKLKEKEEEKDIKVQKKIKDGTDKDKDVSSKVKSKTIPKAVVDQEKVMKHPEKNIAKEKRKISSHEIVKKNPEKDKTKEKKNSDEQEKAKKHVEKDKQKKVSDNQQKEKKLPEKDKTAEKKISDGQDKEKKLLEKDKTTQKEKEKKLLDKDKTTEKKISDGQDKEKKLLEKDKTTDKKISDGQDKEKKLLEKDKTTEKEKDKKLLDKDKTTEKKISNTEDKEKKVIDNDKTTEKKISVAQEKEKKASLEKDKVKESNNQVTEQKLLEKDKKIKKEQVEVKEKEKPNQAVDENEIMKKMMEDKAKQKLEDSKRLKKDENIPKEIITNEKISSALKNNKQEPDKEKPVRNISSEALITKMIRMKKRLHRPKRLSEINISPIQIKAHKNHKYITLSECVICTDSELELDIENINFQKNDYKDFFDKVVGEKIIKCKQSTLNKEKGDVLPSTIYKKFFTEELQFSPDERKLRDKVNERSQNPNRTAKRLTEEEMSKGVIKYTLSDRSFIDKGWTMLPTEKVVRKMNIYRMRPAHPEFDWFEHNKNKKEMHYDSGGKLAEFDDNGRGRWFYRNGKLALDYYDSEEVNTQQRIVIYSNGEPDERGRARPLTILGTFDYLGNGVVFDHSGKIRLKYNQTEGVVLDRSIGPVSHWKWHTLNDPPVLQQVMIDTQLAHKDPAIMKLGGAEDNKIKMDNEEMLAIEFDNFIKEKSKKLTQKFKPFQIKMKALKINENFSLKVLDQASIYLIYRDGTTNLKLNIGMILNHQEIVDTDSAEVGEVANSLERFPAQTDSLAGLQKSVEYAQRVERARMERDRRLRHPEPVPSCDVLRTAASKPLRSRIYTIPSGSTTQKSECRCRYKNSFSNLYYDTRLI